MAICAGPSPPRTWVPGTPWLERSLGARGHGDRIFWLGYLCPPQWSLDSPVPSHTWQRKGCFLMGRAGPSSRVHCPPCVPQAHPSRPTPTPRVGWAGQARRPGRGWPDSHPTGQARCSILGLKQKTKERRKIPKMFSTSHFLENPSRVAAAGNRPWCLRNQGSGWAGRVKLSVQATQPASTPARQDIAVPGLTGPWLQAILGPVKSSIQLCVAQQPH